MSGQNPTQKVEHIRTVAEEVGDLSRDEHPTADRGDVPRVGGLVRDEALRDHLGFAEHSYSKHSKSDEPEFWEIRQAERLLRKGAGDTATTAVRNGNISQLSYIRGNLEHDNDISGLNAVRKLESWLCESEAAKLVYMVGHMGEGKSDFATQSFQVVNHYWNRVNQTIPDRVPVSELPDSMAREPETSNPWGIASQIPESSHMANVEEPQEPFVSLSTKTVRFGSNMDIKTPDGEPNVRLITDFDDLVSWAEGHDSDDELWFILDEASTHLTAQSGENAQVVAEVMGPFVKRMRKLGVSMIIIGHDGRDIAPAVRVLCDFVKKPSKKHIEFYKSVEKRNPVGHMFELDGVPSTDWDFDTNDMAEWSWGSALEDVDEGEGVDLKQLMAERAVELHENVDSITVDEAIDLVSDDKVSISVTKFYDVK
jgi:hypothetical protein